MRSSRFRPIIIACAVAAALAVRPLLAVAGTTGSVSGTITDAATARPLVAAAVSITSPSQTAATTTDETGRFVFLSLPPDTYTISIAKAGYETVTGSGITVNADQALRLTFSAARSLQRIGEVRSRSASDLVRAGTVTDTYSINSATQQRITGLGGGGSLNQAFSALAATPGVSVPSGQNGWSQMAGVTIRGGTHSQIGYEFDGVPVNVGVNGFPGTNLSTLGQQEVQVYSGSAPANSESQGLSGFINQVIKTGTYPLTKSFDAGVGTPSFYHSLDFEVSGATKDRLLSIYAAALGANQSFRVGDQFNGASYTDRYGYGYNVVPCPFANPVGVPAAANYAACYGNGNTISTPGGLLGGPAGFVLAPVNYLAPAYQQDRENIANIHIGIPHKHDGSKDDVQLLYQTGEIASNVYDSANDLGVAPYPYPVGYVYHGPVGAPLPSNYASQVSTYTFPQAVTSLIPADMRDSELNGQSIAKVQYQHNIGTNAYVRAYGYSLYSYFLWNAPNGASSPASNFLGEPPDYKLWTHTSGYSLEAADQISPQHLLLFQSSYTHAPSIRDNSTTWATGPNRTFAVAVDSTDPTSGLCYTALGTPATCAATHGAFAPARATYGSALGLSPPPPSLAGVTCGAGPCEYFVVENGTSGAFNTVVQNTYAASLSDQWKPNDKLTLDVGLRYHDYQITGADTTGPARTFWFNAFNRDNCVSTAPGTTPFLNPGGPTTPCSALNAGSATFTSPTMVNSPVSYTFPEWEPRVGATYALDPQTVLRASWGVYSQPPPTSFQQYNTHQQNLATYLANRFYRYGYTGSGHDIPPQVSYNTDLSYEHSFRGTDVSLKLTPFYRTTRNELTEFFIDPANQLTSGLPVGSLTSKGVEFQLRKGSFDRNGLAALLSYTYTYAQIRYYTLPGGGSVLSPVNNDIKTYNAYTSFCASNPTDARCGSTSSGVAAAPCFTASGAPDPACAAGSIANPYWNAPVQALLDPGASYWPTDPVVATTGLGVNGYTAPHVLTFVLNYRHNNFAITPSLQVQAGQRYGAPEANAGIDPAAGCSPLAGVALAGDPRYPYGAPGGAPYDAVSCNAALNAIPDTFTKQFDAIGAFVSPTQLLGSLTASYDVTKRVTLRMTVANLINQCFGGTQTAWTGASTPKVCSYISGEISRINAPTGNIYNPGASFQTLAQYPYTPYLGPYTMGVVNPSAPLSVYFDVHVKL